MSFNLKSDFKPGDSPASIPAEWLNTVARFLNTFEIQDGYIERTGSGEKSKIWLNSETEDEPQPLHAFQAFIDPTSGNVYCSGGEVCAYDNDWTEVQSGGPWTYVEGAYVYLTFDHTTGDYGSSLQYGTTPPATDENNVTFRFAKSVGGRMIAMYMGCPLVLRITDCPSDV